jgi:hypothetical protein
VVLKELRSMALYKGVDLEESQPAVQEGRSRVFT